MKSNSSKKHNFLSFIKPILTICFALVVLAGVIVGFYGFKSGVDFNGGTQLVVEFASSNVDIEDETKLNEASSTVRQILLENNVVINSFQVQGQFGEKSFVVTFSRVSDENLQNIRLAINEEFNSSETYANFVEDDNAVAIIDNNYDLTRRTSIIDSFISSDELLITISTLLFALTLLVIYSLFRVKLAGAMTILFAGFFSVIMSLVFIAIARVEINSYIFVVMALILGISIYMSADFALLVKDKMRDQLYADKTTSEVANIVVDESLKKNFIITICSLVGLVIIGLLAFGNVMYVSLASLVGIVVVIASQVFVVPAVFAFFARNRQLYSAVKANEPVKTSKTKEEAKTNDVDDSAEVVEIDDK